MERKKAFFLLRNLFFSSALLLFLKSDVERQRDQTIRFIEANISYEIELNFEIQDLEIEDLDWQKIEVNVQGAEKNGTVFILAPGKKLKNAAFDFIKKKKNETAAKVVLQEFPELMMDKNYLLVVNDYIIVLYSSDLSQLFFTIRYQKDSAN